MVEDAASRGYEQSDDEKYEPEPQPSRRVLTEEELHQNNVQLDVTLRMRAAEIAASIPWSAAEPISMPMLVHRFETTYEWLKKGLDGNI